MWFSFVSPDISAARRLPSIFPCWRLLPVIKHPTEVACFCHSSDYLPRLLGGLYLIGFQLLCVAGEPLDQVMRDDVSRATGKRRVSGAGVLQLLPLPDPIHGPALPETGSGGNMQWTTEKRGGRNHQKTPELSLLPPPEVSALQTLVVNFH